MIIILVIALVGLLGILITVGVNGLLGILCSFLYRIGSWFLQLIDFCQSFVRKLCGLETVNGEDLLFDTILMNPAIFRALLAIFVLAVCLVFGFALVQIIRLEYTTEGAKNAKGPIIKKCIKSIFLFALIPFCAFLGIFVSNMLIGVVNNATNLGEDASIAGVIFEVSARDANIVRRYEQGEDLPASWVFVGWRYFGDVISASTGLFNFDGVEYDSDTGLLWDGTNCKTGGTTKLFYNKYSGQLEGAEYVNPNFSGLSSSQIDTAFMKRSNGDVPGQDCAYVVAKSDDQHAISLRNGEVINFTNVDAVEYFYNLNQVDYFVLFVAGWFCLKALISLVFGLVMRAYKVAILTIVSPFPVAMTVIDDGNSLNTWKKKFLAETFSAYGAIAGMNLFLILLPVFNDLTFFESASGPLDDIFNYFCRLIVILVGCYMIKDIVGLVQDLIGTGGNVMSDGEGMTKNIGQVAMQAGSVAMGGLTAAAGLAKAGVNTVNAKLFTQKNDKMAADENAKADKADEKIQASENAIANIEQKAKDEGRDLTDVEKRKIEIHQNSIARNKEISTKHRENAAKYNEKNAKYEQNINKGLHTALRGTSVMGNVVKGSKFYQNVEKFSGGLLTAGGRAKLDKQISESGDDGQSIVSATKKAKELAKEGFVSGSRSDKQTPKRDKQGHIVKDNKGNVVYEKQQIYAANKNSLISRMHAFGMGQTLGYETQSAEIKNINAGDVTANFRNVKHAVDTNLGDMTDEEKRNVSTKEFVDNAQIFTAGNSDATKAAKEFSDAIGDSLKHEKGSREYNEAMNKAKKAQDTLRLANALVEIKPESIAAMQKAVKAGAMPSDISKSYGKQMEALIGKAIEKAQDKVSNTKGDSKTANSIQELLRELIQVTKTRK